MTAWTLVPAYGRDYTAQAAVLADWNGGKDFRIASINAGRDDGRYTNKNDLERYAGQTGVTQVKIRFKRLTDFVLIDIGAGGRSGNVSSFEIFTAEDSPYGPLRSIRLVSTEPDGKFTFRTFSEAKRVLTGILQADEDDLREQLLRVRYNREDARRMRRKNVPQD